MMAISVPTLDRRIRISGEVIQDIAARIVDRFHPIRIILFGSYAYGNPGPESDVDLLVVMDTPIREFQQALEIRNHINPLFGLDLLVYRPENLIKRIELGDSFLQEIVNSGKVLYESTDC